MRRIQIIPIVHSRYDLGSLVQRVDEVKAAACSSEAVRISRTAVETFWEEIRLAMQSSEFNFSQVLIYQDGLPNTGHPERLIEHRIVADLASTGSPNHKLVSWMIEQGATLVGTESTELLLKEYDLVRRSLSRSLEGPDCGVEITEAANELRIQRDRAIALRIDETLPEGKTGMIFLGLLHRVQDFINPLISIEYPFGFPSDVVSIRSV